MRGKPLWLSMFCLILLTAITHAQQALPVPTNIFKAYEKGTRDSGGVPGKNYWQNTADYTIAINFNPETRDVSGNVTINYVNNSNDTLHKVWFKLYPNYYQKGAPRLEKVKKEDLTDGVAIDTFKINKAPVAQTAYTIDATNMVLKVPDLLPHQNMNFSISYHYNVNRSSHLRTGQIEPGAFFIAYFFPRIAVYDDVDGWNKYPYLGQQEFYNDFCHFKAAITVPEKYVVWATGTLLNCNEVLDTTICNRLQHAEQNDSITTIINAAEIAKNGVTAAHDNTWQFEATNVTDFVFATSDHYIWQSSSIVVDSSNMRRTRVDAVYNPAHKDFEEVAEYARKTVALMSFKLPKWPFPYEHETVVDGLDQMEYPMMVNDNPLKDVSATIELTVHEIFHTMFPFYMGINETKYGWMDEGWATLAEWQLSPVIDDKIDDDYGVKEYENAAGSQSDVPITTLDVTADRAFFLNSYPKPAMGYMYVQDMLGDSLFTKALHFYIRQWHGKHPTPYDFFNSINTGSGKNLNWFWQRWFFDNGAPDLAITNVTHNNRNYTITVTSKGTKPVPVDLNIFYRGKSIQTIHQSVAVWQNSNTTTISFTAHKKIKKITLGSLYVPDVNKSNNVYR